MRKKCKNEGHLFVTKWYKAFTYPSESTWRGVADECVVSRKECSRIFCGHVEEYDFSNKKEIRIISSLSMEEDSWSRLRKNGYLIFGSSDYNPNIEP
jgi:hypothetical protein